MVRCGEVEGLADGAMRTTFGLWHLTEISRYLASIQALNTFSSYIFISYRDLVWAYRTAATMSFTSIPILDLSQASDPATKPEFLRQLRHALMEVGFLYLKNVGESEAMFQEVITQGKAFFDIPMEEK